MGKISHSSGRELKLQSRLTPFWMSIVSSTPFLLQSAADSTLGKTLTMENVKTLEQIDPKLMLTAPSCLRAKLRLGWRGVQKLFARWPRTNGASQLRAI